MGVEGGIFLIFFVFFIMMCCGWCCTRKQRGAVLSTPVVVTSATHTAPGGYTVTQIPPTATVYQGNVYAAPYPTQATQVQVSMPVPAGVYMGNTAAPMMGYPSNNTPYPPSAANVNPPSYDAVVAGAGTGPASSAPGYEKQAPYNPNFAS